MIKSNFREWNLDKIDEAFGLEQVRRLPILEELLAFQYQADAYETRYLTHLSESYLELGGDSWNEVELENKFISPLIVFSDISNRKYSYFLERDLSTTIGEYQLNGRVDGMIATGYCNPKVPYFCLNRFAETGYKRNADPDGERNVAPPTGQALIAMLAAQNLNEGKNQNGDSPIFGSYIIGRAWYFMALVGKEYAISKDFSCVDDEVFDIYRILKSLKVQIEKLI